MTKVIPFAKIPAPSTKLKSNACHPSPQNPVKYLTNPLTGVVMIVNTTFGKNPLN
jgi:hypothetical protein